MRFQRGAGRDAGAALVLLGGAALLAAGARPAAADPSPCPSPPGPAACAASPTPSPSPPPATVVISPFEGQPGTIISVTGSRFVPGQALTVYWDTPTVKVAQATAGADGSFHARFRAPDGSEANHAVCAAESGHAYCDVFQLLARPPTPALRLSPARALPGSRVTVTASGLPPGLTLSLSFGGRAGLAHATVAPDGTARTTFQVPEQGPGTVQVCLAGTAGSPCAPLAVLASPPTPPLATKPVSSDSQGPPLLLLLALLALAAAAAAWWVTRRRAGAPLPATVRHRVGDPSLSSTHPQYWSVLSDPTARPPAAPAGAAEPAPAPRRRRRQQEPLGGDRPPPRRLGRRRR